jgi:hypothetical protein
METPAFALDAGVFSWRAALPNGLRIATIWKNT